MSSTSSASYFNQTAAFGNSVIHEMPPEIPSSITVCAAFIDRDILNTIVKEKNISQLNELGGVDEIGKSISTDMKNGITGSAENFEVRKDVHGKNTFLVPPTKTIFDFVYEGFKNIIIAFLLVCGALLFGFGFKVQGVIEGCYEGFTILSAVVIAVFISAICNFVQYRQLDDHFKKTENVELYVIRNGIRLRISNSEIVVGDIVCLYIGDIVPADGLYIEGHSLEVDESSSNPLISVNRNQNPFLLSGSKVVNGNATMVVTSVGTNSSEGENMRSYRQDEQTHLQTKLNKLSSVVGKVGLAVALLVLVVLLLRYIIGNNYKDKSNIIKYENVISAVVGIIAISLTIILVSDPDGLTLAVTTCTLFSLKRMMTDKAMVRQISACETMGSINTMCIDIIGILSSNDMTVTKAYICDTTVSMEGRSYTDIPLNVRQLFTKGISLFRVTVKKKLEYSYIDDAVFAWAHSSLYIEDDQMYNNVMEPSSFDGKKIGILVKDQNSDGEDVINVYWRGDAETIISSCLHCFDSTGSGTVRLEEHMKGAIQQKIETMASSGLLCIAYAYKRLTRAEHANVQTEIPDSDLILLGYVGLKFDHQPETKKAVEICLGAGIIVKMITSENVSIARAIAREYGILSLDNQQLVVEGAEISRYTAEERNEKVEQIRVMANSTPSEKLLMVTFLKNKGDVVGVVGDSIKDALALNEADLCIFMGGDEAVKQSSDIVILNDNFASMAKALKWGRGVYHNIRKFIVFQLTVNIVAVFINIVLLASSGELALTTVELLWVNLIIDTLGAIALATEKPCKDIMSVPPVCRTEPLITNVMWRNIISQAVYQIAVILFIKFKVIFRSHEIVFTLFVLLQISNLFNARKLKKKNVFEGLFSNKLFIGIIGLTVMLQVVIVEFLWKFANTERLDWKKWGLCVGLALLSWPVACIVKFIPVPESPTRRQG